MWGDHPTGMRWTAKRRALWKMIADKCRTRIPRYYHPPSRAQFMELELLPAQYLRFTRGECFSVEGGCVVPDGTPPPAPPPAILKSGAADLLLKLTDANRAQIKIREEWQSGYRRVVLGPQPPIYQIHARNLAHSMEVISVDGTVA